MTLTMGGIAALALVVALAFMKKGLAKRGVVYLMLTVGLLGLGGALGAIVTRIVNSGVHGASNATSRLFGTGVGGFAIMLLLTIFIYPHVRPKGQPPTKATPWLALIWGTVAAAVGGVWATAAHGSGNFIAQGFAYLSDGVTAFIGGF